MANKEINNSDKSNLILSFYKAIKSFTKTLPILFGVVLLVGLFKVYIAVIEEP